MGSLCPKESSNLHPLHCKKNSSSPGMSLWSLLSASNPFGFSLQSHALPVDSKIQRNMNSKILENVFQFVFLFKVSKISLFYWGNTVKRTPWSPKTPRKLQKETAHGKGHCPLNGADWQSASCHATHLYRGFWRGLSLLSTVLAHTPVGESALLWEQDALYMEK